MLIRLAYVSSATTEMADDDLVRLLEQSRQKNQRRNVTGMLLLVDGCFLQVLEGESDDVRAVFASIEKDPRHRGIAIIADEPIDERDFPNWTMGFRKLSGLTEADLPPGFPGTSAEHPGKALDLLLSFKERSQVRA